MAMTTYRNETATETMAARLTAVFDKRIPKRPLTRNPSRGKSGMSQSVMGRRLELHRIDFIDLQCPTILENREDNGETDRGFGRRDHHYKEGVNVAVDAAQFVRERDEAKVYGIQHQFD